jgi:hypothetical protein
MRSRIIFLGLAASLALAAADLPYAGKWKLNTAKSEFAGLTVTYTATPSGEWQATADGNTYKFKLDGNEYPDGMGDTAAWKSVDSTTWQTVWKANGKMVATDTLKVGTDGMLVVNSKGTKPNGETMDDTTTFQRVSGGPGLAGKWKSKGMQSGSPEVIALTATGSNGLSYSVPALDLTCDAKLDGKDYPCTGPTVPPGWTSALVKTGANSFGVTLKKDGKALYRYAYSVSADGKALTATGGATATTEKIKLVYDRQ